MRVSIRPAIEIIKKIQHNMTEFKDWRGSIGADCLIEISTFEAGYGMPGGAKALTEWAHKSLDMAAGVESLRREIQNNSLERNRLLGGA